MICRTPASAAALPNARADHDRRPQHGDRDPRLAEEVLDLAARAQVGRQLLVVGSEATHVDDLPDPGVGGRAAEGPRRGGVATLEVVVVQRVHEVERDVDPLDRIGQGLGLVHVRPDRGARAVVPLGPAGHRPHVVPLLDEGLGEPAADEAGRAGHQDRAVGCHAVHPRSGVAQRALRAMLALRVSSMPAS
jgi:hypothetical protein